MPPSAHPSTQSFRKALGSFATGVTIATTLDDDGAPVGVTANSFNSVSLDPPLVLWSLSKSSFSLPAFAASGHFAIHVLGAEQSGLADHFARSQTDKWDGMSWIKGVHGSPLLGDHAAVFECQTRHQYDGGDHIILVGEVTAFEARNKAPLLYHGGQYSDRRMRPQQSAFDAESLIALVEHAGFIAHHASDAHALEDRLKVEFSEDELQDAQRILKFLITQISGQQGT